MPYIMDAPLQLPTPDMTAFNSSRTQLRQQALALSNIYLPRLREKLRSLLLDLKVADAQGLNTLTIIPIAFRTDGLPDLIKAVTDLREQSPQASSAVIDELIGELQEDAQNRISHVADHLGSLDDALDNFRGIALDDADAVIIRLEADVAPARARIEEESKPLTELQMHEAALNKLIAEVESISLLDRLKPLVESLAKLFEIDPKDPLIGSIQAGLEGLKNQLNLGGEAVRYSHLIALRSRLQRDLDTLNSRLRQLRDEISETELKIGQLKAYQGLAQHQTVYLREVGIIVQAIRDFAQQNQLDANGDVVEQVGRFIENAATMTAYLNGLRREWQS